MHFGLACCGAACLVALAAWLDVPGLSPRLAFTFAFVLVTTEILLVSRLVPALYLPQALLGAAASLGAVALLSGSAPTLLPSAALTAALLAGGSLLGAGLGARIERPGHLLAVAAISSLADVWSVLDAGGPTAQLVAQAAAEPQRLSLFALPFPLWGTGQIEPLIGAGDIVFAALYVATFARHGLPARRALFGLGFGFLLGLGLLLFLERPVPLLPLLGAGVVASDARARTLEARERNMVLGVVALLVVMITLRLGG